MTSVADSETKITKVHAITKGYPTWNPDCIEQSKMFRIEGVTSKNRGVIPVPYSRLFPWKLMENGKIKACFVFYGQNRSEPYPSKLLAESFEVDQQEYERIAGIFRRFEIRPDEFMIEDWELAKKRNWRRNDEFRKRHPLSRPYVTIMNNKVSIEFRGLYPCNVFLGSDEPKLARQIISIANKNGYWVSSKAVHHIIRSWMDDLKSGDIDPIYRIGMYAPCGHNHLWITIERDESLKNKKRDRYAV